MKRFLVACAVMMLGCGTAPSTDAGLEDDAGPRDGGSRDAGHDEDAGMMADAGTDGGPLPILCDAPADGRLDPAGDRTLEIFRADVAADCEGNLAYAWAESRVATTDTERDVDVWLRLLPADGGAPGAAIRLTDDAGNAGNPRVAWSGSQWIVAWSDAAGDPEPVTCFARAPSSCDFEARFAIVDPDGTIARGPEVLASGEGTHQVAAVSADPETGAALFVYIAATDENGDGMADRTDAFGRMMGADGTLAAPQSISRGATVRNGARMARGAGAYWISYIAGGSLTTARWPDGAAMSDTPTPRMITGWVSQIAAAQDGRLALWVNEGTDSSMTDQRLLVLSPSGVVRSQTALEVVHGGGGPGMAWIGGRLFVSDRDGTGGVIELVELDPNGGGELGRSTILESGAAGLFNGFDATSAGEAFVFEANNRFEQLLNVHRP